MVEGDDEATGQRLCSDGLYTYISTPWAFTNMHICYKSTARRIGGGSTFSAQSNCKLQKKKKIRAKCLIAFVAVCVHHFNE